MDSVGLDCRKFAVLSGVRQEPDDFIAVVQPDGDGAQKKGALVVLTEPAGEHPALAAEACRVALKAIVDAYYADNALSLTSSLLAALDGANKALLQYNYGKAGAAGVAHAGQSPQSDGTLAVQTGGARVKRARVGTTAVVVRPDGTGVYLSQLSPSQAYIVHHSMVSALPEPADWSALPGPRLVALPRIEAAETGDDSAEEEDDNGVGNDDPDSPQYALPAQSLGSGPGVEVDMVFRRVEVGDLVVLVSSSLARHLDRQTAEDLFSSEDADTVINGLYAIADEHGLARAHACVLQLNGSKPGLRVDEADAIAGASPVWQPAVYPDDADPSWDAAAPSTGPATPGLQSLQSALSTPKSWLSRLRSADASAESAAWEEPVELLSHGEPVANVGAQSPSSHSSVTLLPHVRRPGDTGELVFDEPEPVVLLHAGSEGAVQGAAVDEPEAPAEEPVLKRVPARQLLPYNNGYPVPVLFPSEDDPGWVSVKLPPGLGEVRAGKPGPRSRVYASDAPVEEPAEQPMQPVARRLRPSIRLPRLSVDLHGYGQAAGRVFKWAGTTAKNMLPERAKSVPAKVRSRVVSKRVPAGALRWVVAGAAALLVVLLLFSVLGSHSNKPQVNSVSLLQKAQEEQQLAAQVGATEVEKVQHLTLARDYVSQVLAADPQSTDAKRLSTKVQSDLDKLNGITRLGATRLLFDLSAADAVTGTSTGRSGPGLQAPAQQVRQVAAGAVGASTTVSTTAQPVDLLVLGNDAYVLDRTDGKVFRCRISTQSCVTVLAAGQSVGGRQVGKLTGITLRVTAVLALDDKLAAYMLDPDSNSWQSVVLGGADQLAQPQDLGTYDGNLYLLNAKPGQVSKYPSGDYASPPADWIRDAASLDQVKDPVAMSIDGSIYLLLRDGRILSMQAGKIQRVIEPQTKGKSAATRLFTGSDAADLYILHSADGTFTRVTKEGQTIGTYQAPAAMDDLARLDGFTVDEERGKVYLAVGEKVYEAVLPGRSLTNPAQQPGTSDQPAPRPTVEP